MNDDLVLEFVSIHHLSFIIHHSPFPMLRLTTLFFLLLALNACQNNGNKESDCKTKPQAMMREGMRGVAEHKFTVSGIESEEFVRFVNGKTLTILQSGCEKIRQEFRFELKEKPSQDDAAFWTDQAILNLAALAVLDPQLMPLSNWVMMIRAQKDDIRLAETKALEGGFYTKIDRILSNDRVFLIITLSNYPT